MKCMLVDPKYMSIIYANDETPMHDMNHVFNGRPKLLFSLTKGSCIISGDAIFTKGRNRLAEYIGFKVFNARIPVYGKCVFFGPMDDTGLTFLNDKTVKSILSSYGNYMMRN